MVKIDEILDLSVAERISIIGQIWESIQPDDLPNSTANEKELDNWLHRYEKGETIFYTGRDIKNELNTET